MYAEGTAYISTRARLHHRYCRRTTKHFKWKKKRKKSWEEYCFPLLPSFPSASVRCSISPTHLDMVCIPKKKNLLRSSCKSFEPPSFHVIYYISIRLQHRFSLTSPDSVALFDSSARVLSPRSISRTLAPSQRWRRIHQHFFSSLSFRLPHWSSSARCRLLRKWKTCSVGQAEASSASVVGGWRKREGAGVRGAAGRAIRLTVSRCVEVAFIARRVRSKQAPNYTAAATLPRLRRGGPLTYKKRKKGSEDSTDTGR